MGLEFAPATPVGKSAGRHMMSAATATAAVIVLRDNAVGYHIADQRIAFFCKLQVAAG